MPNNVQLRGGRFAYPIHARPVTVPPNTIADLAAISRSVHDALPASQRAVDFVCERSPFTWLRAYVAMSLSYYAYVGNNDMPANLCAATGLDYFRKRVFSAAGAPDFVLYCGRAADNFVVAIRGTDSPSQWAYYAQHFSYVSSGSGKGRHLLFIDQAANQMWASLQQILPAWGPVTFTGHSLGGMIAGRLAELAIDAGRPVNDCWAFGSPAYIDRDHRTAYGSIPIFNVQGELDLISRLPSVPRFNDWRADFALNLLSNLTPSCIQRGHFISIDAPRRITRGGVEIIRSDSWFLQNVVPFAAGIIQHYSDNYVNAIWRRLSVDDRMLLQDFDQINFAVNGFAHT